MATFIKASKTAARLRFALLGPPGSGKTYSALGIASGLGKRIAVIDTERGSASKYADKFSFDVLELDTHHPQQYIDAIHAAEAEGYEVLIIDSLSHAWNGKDGALELVDKAAKRSNSGNSFTAWRDVSPLFNSLIDTITRSQCHVIVTLRSKVEYTLEEDGRGRKVPKKVGLAPVIRDGCEYEMDIVGELNIDHEMVITKTRCSVLTDQVITKPGKGLADTLKAWLCGDALPELTEIDTLGTDIYGDDWTAKRADLVRAITNDTTDDIAQLNRTEATRLLDGLKRRQSELQQELRTTTTGNGSTGNGRTDSGTGNGTPTTNGPTVNTGEQADDIANNLVTTMHLDPVDDATTGNGGNGGNGNAAAKRGAKASGRVAA